MSPFSEYQLPAQRRAIINYLVAAKGFEMNDGLMMALLRDDLMAVESRAVMKDIEDWLAEQGVLTVAEPRQGKETLDRSLTLTPLGLEVAQGVSDIPGILRPSRAMVERMMRLAAGLDG